MPYLLGVQDFDFIKPSLRAGDVMTMKDIAQKTGKSYWYIRALACGSEKSKPPFPEPITKIGNRKVWLKRDIHRWMVHRKMEWVHGTTFNKWM